LLTVEPIRPSHWLRFQYYSPIYWLSNALDYYGWAFLPAPLSTYTLNIHRQPHLLDCLGLEKQYNRTWDKRNNPDT
jgi:hypothetical protein